MGPLTRRGLCRSVLAIAASSLAGPMVPFARAEPDGGDGTNDGAIMANAAVAEALQEAAAQLDRFNHYGIGNMASLVERVATATAIAASLSENEHRYLRLRFPKETGQILQSARDYLAATGPVADLATLAAVRDAMAKARQDLSARKEGKGLPAAILLCAAFGAEFGAARRLTNNRENLRSLLDDYRIWAESMRSMSEGAIPFRRAVAAQSHDEELKALAETPYGKRLGIGRYVVEGSQAEKKIADPCVIFYSRYMVDPAQTRGGFTVPDDHRLNIFWNSTYVPWVIAGYSRIRVRDNAQFGIRLIEYSLGDQQTIPTSGIIGSLRPPIGGEFCYAISSRGVGTASQAVAQANDHPSLKEDRRDRKAIVGAVKNANACRIEIALAGRAIGMLRRFDGIREFFEREI